jgi:integrase
VFLDLEQRRRLLEKCSGAFRDLVESAMLTGCRYGELRQLKVQDFDAAERCLEIRKGKTGGRTVALSDAAHKFFANVSRDKLPKATLLVRDDGEPWAHSDQDKPMRIAARKAKVPAETVFYTLRHSFIAEALKGGLDVVSVAKNCGTSVQIIESNYAKFVPRAISAALNKVELV